MTSDYRNYSNEELNEMIDELLDRDVISEKLANKFRWSIFKRTHERYHSDEERKQAQRKNALQWFYRKKLINTWNYYWCDEINKVLAKRYKARVEKERNKVKFTPIIDDSEEKTSSE